MKFDWYEASGKNISYLNKIFSCDATDIIIKILKGHNEGSSNIGCRYGTTNKECIKLLT